MDTGPIYTPGNAEAAPGSDSSLATVSSLAEKPYVDGQTPPTLLKNQELHASHRVILIRFGPFFFSPLQTIGIFRITQWPEVKPNVAWHFGGGDSHGVQRVGRF